MTTAALKMFQNLRYSGTDGNDIYDGLLPFAFILRHESSTTMIERLEAMNQVVTYDNLMTLSANLLSLAGSKNLSKSAAFIPMM